MTLKEELKTVSGRKRRFILLRVIDVGTEAARQLCGITKGTYNSWLQNPAFVELYRRRAELAIEYKQEALQLLRRGNQLQAVLLEEKVINKMKDEIESGVYVLLKTNLAREVYSKLINDLDYQPQVANLTWAQRVQQLFMPNQPQQIEGGEVTDAEVITETVGEPSPKHQESDPLQSSEQTSPQTQEEGEA